MRPIEAILNYGSKDSTYKLALIRAINDWVIEHATEAKDHRIPMSWIALKFLEYYWPLTVQVPVHQMYPKQGRRLQVARLIDEYVDRVKAGKGMAGVPGAEHHPAAPDHWTRLSEVLLHESSRNAQVQALVLKVRRTVLDQPVRYVRNVGGSQVPFFALETGDEREFDAAREQGMVASLTKELRDAPSLLEMIRRDPTSFVIPRATFEAIRPLRYCILGSLTAKWYAETERYYRVTGADIPPDLMACITGPISARDQLLAARYREIYLEHGLVQHCVLTGQPLRHAWDLDHVVPWSRLPVDAFWNLVPLTKKANSWKSNVLVRIEGEYQDRLENHFERCLEMDHPFIQSDLKRLPNASTQWTAGGLRKHVAGLIDELALVTGLPVRDPLMAAG